MFQGLWLLQEDVAQAMDRYIAAGMLPSLEKSQAYIAEQEVAAVDRPRSFNQAGDVAEIRVHGVLTPRPSLFAMLFGGNTSYADIQASIAMANAEPTVKRVIYDVNSPGGTVEGLFDTLAAMDSLEKPSSVRASKAASAAFAIASSGGKIVATGPAAEFGSIGVVATYLVFPELIDVTSTNAPNKRPDVTTDEGKAVVRAYLDEIHDLFVDAIARGRGVSTRVVNEEFGRGSMMLAASAKRAGMIDTIPTQARRARAEEDTDPATEEQPERPKLALVPPAEAPTAAKAAANQGKKKMTKEELKAQHPELYALVFEEGSSAGTTKERKRCMAHLKLGKSCNALDFAFKSIESGASTLDEDVHAEYLSLSRNHSDQKNAQADSDAAANVLAGAGANPKGTPEGGQDIGDLVAAKFDTAKGGTGAAA